MEIEQRTENLIEYYNFITGDNIDDIDVLDCGLFERLILIPYKSIIKTLAKRDILAGVKDYSLNARYGLTKSEIRSIKEVLGIYSPRYKKKSVKIDLYLD